MRTSLKILTITTALVVGIAAAPAIYAQSTGTTPAPMMGKNKMPMGQIGEYNMPRGQMGQYNMPRGQMGQGNMPRGHMGQYNMPRGQMGQGNMPMGQGNMMAMMKQMMQKHTEMMKTMMKDYAVEKSKKTQ